jgi:hypothetical protein
VGGGLGVQAGKFRLRKIVSGGGFTRLPRAASTPFNMVLEARPEAKDRRALRLEMGTSFSMRIEPMRSNHRSMVH